MKIRRAQEKDIDRMLELLSQVLEVHAAIRPDIFISGRTKYTREMLVQMLHDESIMIFAAADDKDEMIGYAFCKLREQPFATTMVPFKSIYIDDLCVDEAFRGQHIGEKLFSHLKEEAKKMGCYEIILHVWEGNDGARAFYDRMGMRVKETTMELIL